MVEWLVGVRVLLGVGGDSAVLEVVWWVVLFGCLRPDIVGLSLGGSRVGAEVETYLSQWPVGFGAGGEIYISRWSVGFGAGAKSISTVGGVQEARF